MCAVIATMYSRSAALMEIANPSHNSQRQTRLKLVTKK